MSLGISIDEALSDLIGHFYDAAADASLWPGMASRIAATLDSSSAVLKMTGADGGVRLLDTTDNLAVADREQDWADHWHRHDMWVERSVAVGLSRVITSRDLVSADEERLSPFYQEWLRRLDIHHMVGAVFPAGDGRIGVLGIHRPRAGSPYARADRGKVALLLPHLHRALHMGQRLGRASLAHAAGLDALDRIDIGVVVVDRRRRIVHANALAETLLRDGPEIGVLNGRLIVRRPGLDSRLAALVQAGVEPARTHAAPPPGALEIPRDDRLPLMLAAAPLRPGRSRQSGQPPLALVFLRDPEHPTAMLEQLRDLFGLTRTEAAIAAELARGRSPAEIAGALGIGLATVRSHLKNVLAKTGTGRQAEAVSLIARSVATFADRQ